MRATRFIIVKSGCPFCREALKAIFWINLRLPLDKRIIVIDNYRWEEFGLREFPITELFDEKEFNAYPFIYIDGFIIDPAQKILLRATLEGYLKNEFKI